jgi:hypothetical protein
VSLQPPNTVVDDWVANSGTSHHTTPLAGKISTFRPLNSANHSLIVVGNGSTLQVTSVGDSVIPGPFYLSIMLVPNIVQTLLFVRRFTTDNLCFMEFDSFGLFVKDLSTRNMIVRSKSNSTGPLYTLRLPGSLTRCRPLPCAMSAVAALRVLAAVASSTWHYRLGHPGLNAISSLSRSSFISYTSNKHEFCHACQLGKHTRLPFYSSSNRAVHAFDLFASGSLDLSDCECVSYEYYLVLLDDFTHYLWNFPLKLTFDTFTTLTNFFSYVTTQFSCTVKAIQCDNGREFDNSCTWTFLLYKGTHL